MREKFWNTPTDTLGSYCNNCGGYVLYDYGLNKIYCDTCSNEIEEWM